MKANVHVKDGKCFEVNLLQLQYFIPGWVESDNVTEVYIHLNGDCENCQLYETEAAKALEAGGKAFLGVHTDSACFVVPCEGGSVRRILGEFMDSDRVLEIDVWCTGFADGSKDCQCGAEFLEYLRGGLEDG